MPHIRNITTLAHAARLLSVDASIVSDIHMMMDASRGAIWIDDGSDDGIPALTELGMRHLRDELAAQGNLRPDEPAASS